MVRTVFFTFGFVAMLLSWWLLSVYLAAWTEGVLAPWDVDKRALPEVGTTARTVNDFFEGRGWWVPAGASVTISAICAFSRLLRTGFRQATVPWEIAATNLVFGFILFFMGYPIGEIDNLWQQRFSSPDVPHFYSFYITSSLLLWIAYFVVQRRGVVPASVGNP